MGDVYRLVTSQKYTFPPTLIHMAVNLTKETKKQDSDAGNEIITSSLGEKQGEISCETTMGLTL